MQSYVKRFIGGDLSVLPHILMCIEGNRSSALDCWEERMYQHLVKMLIIVDPQLSTRAERNVQDELQEEHYVLMMRVFMAAISSGGDVARGARQALLGAGLFGCRAMNLDRFFLAQSWMVSHVVRFVVLLANLYGVHIADILTVYANILLAEDESRAFMRYLPTLLTYSGMNDGTLHEFAPTSSFSSATVFINDRSTRSASDRDTARRWRDLPKQPSFVPLAQNPFYFVNSDANTWIPPQFPAPVVAFARQFGEGCIPTLPQSCLYLLSPPLMNIESPKREGLPPGGTPLLAARRLCAALDFEQQWDPLFARYLSSGLLFAWGVGSAFWGEGGESSTISSGEVGTGSSKVFILSPITLAFPASVVGMTCGAYSCYFVTLDNKLYSCGKNDWGQLGSKRRVVFQSTLKSGIKEGKQCFYNVTLQREDNIAKVEAGSAFAVAIVQKSNRLYVWGQNTCGQCLMSGSTIIAKPVVIDIPDGYGTITDVACGSCFAAIIFSSGAMGTWGAAPMLGLPVSFEQLQETETKDCTQCAKTIHIFKPMHGSIIKLRAGSWHCLAITSKGVVYSWGTGLNGRLGHEDNHGGEKMRRIESLDNHVVVDASCGSVHSAVLTEKGLVFVFGENSSGQLGFRNIEPHRTAEPLPLPKRAIAVSCGHEHTCVLLEDGDVMTCGTLRSCGVGLGHGVRFGALRRILQNYLILSISSGATHGVAAGLPRSLNLQQIKLDAEMLPRDSFKWINQVIGRHGVAAAAAGRGFIVVVTEDGGAFAIGQSERGQLGTSEVDIAENTRFYKVSLPHGVGLCAVDCGLNYTIGISTSGSVYSWGWNSHGQLGHGDSVPLCESVVAPQEVEILRSVNVVQVACGGTFAVALTQDGEVYTWGEALYCGHRCRNTPHLMKPMLLEQLRDIVAVAAGASHAVALSCDHVMYTWGGGIWGSSGTSAAITPTPSVVAFAHAVRQIGCGPLNTFVITDVGDLFVWGWGEIAHSEAQHQGSTTCLLEEGGHRMRQGQPKEQQKLWPMEMCPTLVASGVRDATFTVSSGFIIKEDGTSTVFRRCFPSGEKIVVSSFTKRCSSLLWGQEDHNEFSPPGFFLRCFRGYDHLLVLLERERPSAAAVGAAIANMTTCLHSSCAARNLSGKRRAEAKGEDS